MTCHPLIHVRVPFGVRSGSAETHSHPSRTWRDGARVLNMRWTGTRREGSSAPIDERAMGAHASVGLGRSGRFGKPHLKGSRGCEGQGADHKSYRVSNDAEADHDSDQAATEVRRRSVRSRTIESDSLTYRDFGGHCGMQGPVDSAKVEPTALHIPGRVFPGQLQRDLVTATSL